MIVMTKKMKRLIIGAKRDKNSPLLEVEYKKLKKLLVPRFLKIDDCIIITNEEKSKLERNFDNVLKSLYSNDKTHYEYSINETLINYFFENCDSTSILINLGLIVLDIWGLKLKEVDAKSKFWIILGCDKNKVTLRFHKARLGNQLIFTDFNESDDFAVYCKLF
ncbi:hypothetical protein [Fusobacterium sp. PH5-44]